MKLSYDYEELIQEIKEEIADGILKLTDDIQVLRTDEFNVDYKPIIDWYYPPTQMENILKPDIFDDEEEVAELEELKAQYELDMPNLETIMVGNCLIEMEEMNAII